MSLANWPTCLAWVLDREGGYVADPLDPGGATNMGITLRTLSAWRHTTCLSSDVRALTAKEAGEIYHAWYWATYHADVLPAGVDLAIFDASVMTSPGNLIRLVQAAAGATVDGIYGPLTLAAVQRAAPAVMIDALAHGRLDFYNALVHSTPSLGKFLHGWVNRVTMTTRRAHEMLIPVTI